MDLLCTFRTVEFVQLCKYNFTDSGYYSYLMNLKTQQRKQGLQLNQPCNIETISIHSLADLTGEWFRYRIEYPPHF